MEKVMESHGILTGHKCMNPGPCLTGISPTQLHSMTITDVRSSDNKIDVAYVACPWLCEIDVKVRKMLLPMLFSEVKVDINSNSKKVTSN